MPQVYNGGFIGQATFWMHNAKRRAFYIASIIIYDIFFHTSVILKILKYLGNYVTFVVFTIYNHHNLFYLQLNIMHISDVTALIYVT